MSHFILIKIMLNLKSKVIYEVISQLNVTDMTFNDLT